jgi:hypothetical protein
MKNESVVNLIIERMKNMNKENIHEPVTIEKWFGYNMNPTNAGSVIELHIRNFSDKYYNGKEWWNPQTTIAAFEMCNNDYNRYQYDIIKSFLSTKRFQEKVSHFSYRVTHGVIDCLLADEILDIKCYRKITPTNFLEFFIQTAIYAAEYYYETGYNINILTIYSVYDGCTYSIHVDNDDLNIIWNAMNQKQNNV